MKRSSTATYNLVSLVFVGLTLFVFLCIVGMMARVIAPPGFLAPRQAAVAPTFLPTPTETITPRPSATPTASDTATASNTPTPLPPTATQTLPPSATPLPSNTPPPSDTPSKTPLPSNTPIPSKTPLPTKTPVPSKTPKGFVASATVPPTAGPAPTSASPFVLAPGSPSAGPNPDSTTGCNFEGISGLVLDMSRTPLTTRIKINIAGPKGQGVAITPNPANDTLFSPGSWLLKIDDKVTTASYTVQLLNSQNVPLSDKVPIKFTSDCQKNIIFVNFIQVRPVDLP